MLYSKGVKSLPTNQTSLTDTDVFIENISDESIKEKSSIAPGEIVLGSITEINALGQPFVDFSVNPNDKSLCAITTLVLTEQHVNRQVALLFKDGDLAHPIVIGLIHSPLQAMIDNFEDQQNEIPNSLKTECENDNVELAANFKTDDILVEGKKVIFEAQDEMIFKCGESSITLTKEGKVLIRGKYLLNRSSGVNRIMGGSVQVN